MPSPRPHASRSPIVMWNSTEPLSGSSDEKVVKPIWRQRGSSTIEYASASGDIMRTWKKRSISDWLMGRVW